MSKKCAKCGIEKDEHEFRVDNKSKDKLGCWCKDCDREYKREYYAKNKERIRTQYNERYKNDLEYRVRQKQSNKNARLKHIDTRHQQEKRYRSSLQDFIDDFLKIPCVKCGEHRKWLIQFHHIKQDEKSFQVQAIRSKERLLNEAKKCICLCSNCHSEYHYFFGKHPVNPIESLEEYLSEEFDGNATYIRKRAGNDNNCGEGDYISDQ